MKTRQHIIPFLVMLALSGLARLNAQEDLRYKDIMTILQTRGNEEAYPLLLYYQRQDPLSANTYFHLGRINYKWALAYDPITEFEQVKYFIYNTRLFYGLAKYYLDERQARRFGEYFTGIPRKSGKTDPDINDISSYITSRIDSIDRYDQSITSIQKYYMGATGAYQSCINEFMLLCKRYNMLKDIYLTADDSLYRQVDRLEKLFDSTLVSIHTYRQMIDTFPIRDYHQEYSLKPIETYRLDGLTGSDFSKNSILLWDYGRWVKDLRQILTIEILALRQRIDSTRADFDQSFALLSGVGEYSPGSTKLARLAPDLKNKLGKYDFQPLVIALFKYQEAKLDLLAMGKQKMNESLDSMALKGLTPDARFSAKFTMQKLHADSLLNELGNITDSIHLNKYREFFATWYQGMPGLKRYVKEEHSANNGLLDSNLVQLKNGLLLDIKVFHGLALSYKKFSIPLEISSAPDGETPSDRFYTLVRKTDGKNNIYLAGSRCEPGKKATAFVAFADKGTRVTWVKQFDFNEGGMDYDDHVPDLDLTDNGCFAVVSSIINAGDTTGVLNTLVRLDGNGNEQLRLRLNTQGLVRFMSYDGINDKLLIAFQGRSFNPYEDGASDLNICMFSGGGEAIWKTKSVIEGRLVDIVRMNDSWLAFCNANRYSGPDGQLIESLSSSNTQGTGIYCLLINSSGELLGSMNYRSAIPGAVWKVMKLSSEMISLLGFQSNENEIPGYPSGNPGMLNFILVDAAGRLIFLNR